VLSLCQAPGFRGTIDWLDLLASVGLLHRAGKIKEPSMHPGIVLASCPAVPAQT
jgi:hypothetical protein